MRNLILTIFDELKNHDIQQIEYIELDKISNFNVLAFDKIENHITICKSTLTAYKHKCDEIEYYKIPSNLTFEKILVIIWSIFQIDYTNNANLINPTNPTNLTKYNRIKIVYYDDIKKIDIDSHSISEKSGRFIPSCNTRIIFNSNNQNLNPESVIQNIIKRTNYFDIFYEFY